MNIQVLPNYAKKAGLLLYIIGAAPSAYSGFIAGINAGSKSEIFNFIPSRFSYFEVIMYIGILVYFLSKEKIEDDYINKLRLESFQLTAVIGVSITFIMYLFSHDLTTPINAVFETFLFIYLLVFYLKKRADL